MVGGLFFLLFSAPSFLLSYLASGLRQQSICRIRFREWQIPNNQVITIIPVGDEPYAFAWNPIQNRTYVANYASSTISVIRDVTGIEEYFLPDVKPLTSEIYPNPAKSFFVIRSSLPVKEIEIFDVSGKLIKEITFSTKEPKISLNGIKSGVYLLKIKTENKEFTKKLIIK
jgi:hypothetical protein